MRHNPSSRAPGYRDLLRTPGALVFFIATIIGRIPMPMRPLGTILMIEELTGSYGLAGSVGAATTLVAAMASPRLGALTDRYGDRPVLLWTLLAHTVGIAGLILAVYVGLPAFLYFGFSAIIGLSTMPFPSLSRARWATTLGPGPALEKAYALESIATEIGFILGPIIVVPLAIGVFPSAGLLAVILFVAIASVTLAMQPRHAEHETRAAGVGRGGGAEDDRSVIGNRGVQILVTSLFSLGVIFGAVELMIVAFAEEQGSPGAASYLAATFAFGSMVAAIITGSRGWSTPPQRRFVISSVALTFTTIPILLANSIPFMAVAVFLTGLGIAPTMIAANTVVEGLAARRRLNEAFAWLGSAIASGVAIGSIISGIVIDAFGTRGGQAVGVVAGGIAMVVVLAGANRLRRRSPNRTEPDPLRS